MVAEQLRNRGIRDLRVLAAMERVPRHEFVAREQWHQAYADHPLPIGSGQTISQPFIVAYMIEAMVIRPEHVVLEVGTGSGYATAILAELAREVYSIERHDPLARDAAATLQRLGYGNIHVSVGDGSLGVPGGAPYDSILVSAAAPQVPEQLFDQLREEGRLVVPVGSEYLQDLLLVRKVEGEKQLTNLEGCRFVPLIGSGGFQRD